MDHLYNKLIIIIIILSLFGCKEDSPTENNAITLNKSSKRGIAYDMKAPADYAVISKGISWWYNWNYTTNAPSDFYKTYQMEFIPMLWGGNTSNLSISMAETFILSHPEVQYILVMNEPNLLDQANRTPSQAASDWLKYEQVVADLATQNRTVYLVGPAMNWGTMTGYSDPVTWLDAFYSAYRLANNGKDPKIDYLAFHWYDYGLSAQLDRLKKYGKKIWITELANWNSQINSYAKQKEQMKDMVNICETRSDVFRYAWFIGRGSGSDSHFTYLFTANSGELTELGEYYINLPYSQ
jgi:hypothetical protein